MKKKRKGKVRKKRNCPKGGKLAGCRRGDIVFPFSSGSLAPTRGSCRRVGGVPDEVEGVCEKGGVFTYRIYLFYIFSTRERQFFFSYELSEFMRRGTPLDPRAEIFFE